MTVKVCMVLLCRLFDLIPTLSLRLTWFSTGWFWNPSSKWYTPFPLPRGFQNYQRKHPRNGPGDSRKPSLPVPTAGPGGPLLERVKVPPQTCQVQRSDSSLIIKNTHTRLTAFFPFNFFFISKTKIHVPGMCNYHKILPDT